MKTTSIYIGLFILILAAAVQLLRAEEITLFSTTFETADGRAYRRSYKVDSKIIAPFMETNLFKTEISLSPQEAYQAALSTMKESIKKMNLESDHFLLEEIKYGNYSAKRNAYLGCPFYRVEITVFLRPTEKSKLDAFRSEYLVLPDRTVITGQDSKE